LSSPAKEWRARLVYRGLLYKLVVLSLCIGLGVLIWRFVGPVVVKSWYQIGPKVPFASSTRTAVLVETHHLTHSELKRLHDQVTRVVVYQTPSQYRTAGRAGVPQHKSYWRSS